MCRPLVDGKLMRCCVMFQWQAAMPGPTICKAAACCTYFAAAPLVLSPPLCCPTLATNSSSPPTFLPASAALRM